MMYLLYDTVFTALWRVLFYCRYIYCCLNHRIQILYQIMFIWWNQFWIVHLTNFQKTKNTESRGLIVPGNKDKGTISFFNKTTTNKLEPIPNNNFVRIVSWEKTPNHLAVILPRKFEKLGTVSLEKSSYQKSSELLAYIDLRQEFLTAVQNLVLWSLMHEIKQLTLYCRNESLKIYLNKIIDNLRESVLKCAYTSNTNSKEHMKILLTCSNKLYYIIPGKADPKSDSNIEPNIQINLLSRNDGFPKIVQFTKNISLKISESSLISSLYEDEYNHSEPQAIIVFSSSVTLNDFPCWKLCQPEIIETISTDVTYTGFSFALYRYSKTVQRNGK
ncbi:hypothetical protein BB558_006615 [Smittium angustum]|uniref:ditrans,polycis-polyprenyl diphosphate synthase [(2E,6E)-farnesyldiphosphate specific] n=1 Tax=Smittium angustum TaxID=133377 RepID=A0A2U1IX87_SMIAN|nr:hypothetical protein BB558_006615 [Smittium angustum]